jgi:hypothetical protein
MLANSIALPCALLAGNIGVGGHGQIEPWRRSRLEVDAFNAYRNAVVQVSTGGKEFPNAP